MQTLVPRTCSYDSRSSCVRGDLSRCNILAMSKKICQCNMPSNLHYINSLLQGPDSRASVCAASHEHLLLSTK